MSSTLRMERRKVIIGLALAATLSAGAAAAVGDAADYGRIVSAIRRADGARLPLCLIGELAAYAGYLFAYRTVAAAAGGPLLRYRDALRVVALGFGAYLVGSAAGSLGIDFYAMRKAGARQHEAVRRSLALNTLDASGLLGFAAIAGAVLLARGASGAALIMAAAWVGAVPAAVFGAAWFTHPEREQRIARWHGKLQRVFADVIVGVGLVRQVITHPRRYLGGAAGYPLYWLGDFAILWTALWSFGVVLDPAYLVVAEATAWLLTLLPLPAGGSGAAEASMAYTLHVVGVPLAEALPAAIVYRLVSFWLPLAPALLLVPQIGRLQRSLEHSPRAAADPDAAVPPSQAA